MDRPIFFSGPMVRALLDGTKTQTRRVLKPQPSLQPGETVDFCHYCDEGYAVWEPWADSKRCTCRGVKGIRFFEGDRLYVREALQTASNEGARWLSYTADGKDVWPLTEWHRPHNSIPSIHMPRWASRITLVVTDVRVQRLQDISEDDAQAEGVRLMRDGGGTYVGREGSGNLVTPWLTAVEAFADLWDRIHGPGAWEANPWVVAVSFSVHRANIDQLASEAA